MVFMALNDLTYHLYNLPFEIVLDDHWARYFGIPYMTSGNSCHHLHIGVIFLALLGNTDSLRNSEYTV